MLWSHDVMSKNKGASIARRVALRHLSATRDTRRSVDGSVVKNICLSGAESLLNIEEDFLSTLSQINTMVLNTLLQATDSHDPSGRDHLQALKIINDKFQQVWELTAACFQTLKHSYELLAVGVQEIYLMTQENQFLHAYTEYFVSLTNYLAIKGFEKSSKQTSYWKANVKPLMQLIKEESETPVHVLLQRVFTEPFREHIKQYSFLLSKMNAALLQDAGVTPLTATLNMFVQLQSYISQSMDEAFLTRILWTTLSRKLVAALCSSDRRLQEDSRNVPVTVTNARYDRVLLFTDSLVFLQGNDVHMFDLRTVWVDQTSGQKAELSSLVLRVVTPGEEFLLATKEPHHKALWTWKLNQLIRQRLEGQRDFPLWGKTGDNGDPPTCRLVTYTYKNEGRFKGAVYEGDMSWGKPHGKGTLKWPDGRNHVGDFKFGQEDGFGICLIPDSGHQDRYHCYKCHWRSGAMQGYGICEYADDSVYKGFFKDNLRHGFGILENQASNPFRYTGNWEKDRRAGYGVCESCERGERYIGMWQENQRHGPGIVLFHSGSCYQGNFSANKLVGSGILITEDGTVYEGEFTEQCSMSGKGKLTFANGFTLVGTFNKTSSSGLQTQGVLSTSSSFPDETIKMKWYTYLFRHHLRSKEPLTFYFTIDKTASFSP